MSMNNISVIWIIPLLFILDGSLTSRDSHNNYRVIGKRKEKPSIQFVSYQTIACGLTIKVNMVACSPENGKTSSSFPELKMPRKCDVDNLPLTKFKLPD